MAISALKVTIYLNRDSSAPDGYLSDAILRYLADQKVLGASVYHPAAGFGASQRLHTQGAGSVDGEHLPLTIVFVEEESKARQILPALLDLVTDGFVEAHPTEILKTARRESRVIA